MLSIINSPLIPPNLCGPLLVDSLGLPRYWGTAWAIYAISDLAESSTRKKLGYLEAFYRFVDEINGPGCLDDAIAACDIQTLGEVLEAYFVSIHNQQTLNFSSQDRWQVALDFIQGAFDWLGNARQGEAQFSEIQARLLRLGNLYAQLKYRKRPVPHRVQALPAVVLEALYEMLDPESSTNPFRNSETKWRVFLVFVFMLHQGLRRGELLLLSADVVKCAPSSKHGLLRYWMTVQFNDYETKDCRYTKPGIKTATSVRQLPVSKDMALLVQTYVENYRGQPDHSFLLNSQWNHPFSAEGITRIFKVISCHLPKTVVKALEDRTGNSTIHGHSLRHTCSVFRLNQMLGSGTGMDEAMQNLRTFFGWSKESTMPLKYARAVFEDRLVDVWDKNFDDRVSVLRGVRRSEP